MVALCYIVQSSTLKSAVQYGCIVLCSAVQYIVVYSACSTVHCAIQCSTVHCTVQKIVVYSAVQRQDVLMQTMRQGRDPVAGAGALQSGTLAGAPLLTDINNTTRCTQYY